jgi:phosphotransferase system HPr (HPr) family protein
MEYIFKVKIPDGLHARPCNKLVDILKNFAPLQISSGNQTINTLSILELLLLKITYGSDICICCEEPLPEEAINKLDQLFSN